MGLLTHKYFMGIGGSIIIIHEANDFFNRVSWIVHLYNIVLPFTAMRLKSPGLILWPPAEPDKSMFPFLFSRNRG